MRNLSLVVLIFGLVGFADLNAGKCSQTSFHDSKRDRDFEAVQAFVNSKRTIPFVEKKDWLKIFGLIKVEGYYRNEERAGIPVRGAGALDPSNVPIPRANWDAAVDLNFLYKCKPMKGLVRVQYKNNFGMHPLPGKCDTIPAGLHGSGTCNRLCLKDAYIKWRMFDCNESRDHLDFGIGRRQIAKFFESRVQYHSEFDGMMFKYSHKFEPSWKVYGRVGGFIVDERADHYAYIGEVGVLDLLELNIDLKYSFVDWLKNGKNRCETHRAEGTQFRNSQWLAAYHLDPDVLGKKLRLYGAVVCNHAAERRARTNNKRANLAWYVAFVLGDVKKECDWAFNMAYEYVEAQAVPDRDVHGIGRGNILKEYFSSDGRGNTNYKGWHFELLYAITDKLTVDAIFDYTRAADRSIGGKHVSSKCEVDLALAF